MELFGGFMKGLKPLMDATGVKPDEDMKAAIAQGEVAELEGKKKEALAKIGLAAYEMVMKSTYSRELLLPLCSEVDALETQLKNKMQELNKAKEEAENKRREEEARLAARTCPTCGEENAEGSKFCQSCGGKLGIKKPLEIICAKCGAANGPESKFCGECGEALALEQEPAEIKCASCEMVYPAGTKFCIQCGSRL
ncbi:MAG: zinc ribbon domain-containing protein [Bacillota bacterium]|nr:zinc ribbon domain-containing protein [Bacillota bacterium]